MPVALGLDFGTTSISAAAVAEDGRLLARATRPHRADVTGLPTGYAEQSPVLLLETGLTTLAELVRALPTAPTCLGLTGQMHGLLLADADLRPLSNLITWQDKRSLDSANDGMTFIERFRSLADAPSVLRTGCTPSPGYLAVTLDTLVRRNALPPTTRHALIFADWVAATLTGTAPVTDRTNAASTGVYDLERDVWSELIEAIGLPQNLFPPVVESGAAVGGLTDEVAAPLGLPPGLPVSSAIGDHQAAVLGSLPTGERAIHINIGTGGQVSLPTDRFLRTSTSDTRYLPDDRYLLVGAGLAGGDAFAWVRQSIGNWLAAFGVKRSSDELFAMLSPLAASAPPGCDGLRCEPFFRGTRRDPARRGVLSGISIDNFSPGYVARAVLEGIAAALAEFAIDHTGRPDARGLFKRIIATGNAVRKNRLLAVSLARSFGLPVFAPEHEEEAAYGAAVLAGVRAGMWSDLESIGQGIRFIRLARQDDTD